MKKLPLILFALLPILANCQKADSTKAATDTGKVKNRHFSIGLTFSPDWGYRSLTYTDATSQWIVKSRNGQEVPAFIYSGGISFKYKLSKNISFGLGVVYAVKGYETSNMPLLYGSQIDPTRGFVYNPSITATHLEFIYHYNYFGFPVDAEYGLRVKKWRFYALLGISPELLNSYNVIEIPTYADGHKTQTTYHETSSEDFYKHNIDIFGALGASFDISKRFYVSMEPTYRYSFVSTVNAPIHEFLYNIGMNTGVYFRL